MRRYWWQNLPICFAPDGEGAGGGGGNGGGQGGDGGQGGAGGAGGAAGAGGDGKGDGGQGAAAGAAGGDGKRADKGAGDAGAGKGADGGQQGDDWRSGIQDQKLRDYAGKFTTPADLAKSALEFRQKLSTAVVLPGKDAKPEEIAEFHKKLGVPDKPDGYAVELPKDLPESLQLNDASKAQLDAFKQAMHKAGATPAAVQAAVGWYYGTLVEQLQAGEAAAEQGRAEAETALKREWGNDFDGNVRYAQRAAKAFGGDAFVQMLENATVNGIKLGDHPDFLRTFAAIGRRMGEDNLHVGAMTQDEQKTLQEQHADLSKQIAEAHAKGDRDKARQLDQQRQAISTKLYGTSPIVGTAGRTV